jgi:hypothetical protein
MAALDKQPVAGAGPLNGLLTWVDALPADQAVEDQWGNTSRRRISILLLRLAVGVRARAADRYRHLRP